MFYTPTGNFKPGAWEQGPDMPLLNTSQYPADPIPLSTNNGVVTYNNYLQLSPEDAPSAMLANGKILCELSRDGTHMPVWFYEFDPVANQFEPAPCPTNAVPGSYYYVEVAILMTPPCWACRTGRSFIMTPKNFSSTHRTARRRWPAGQPVINSVTWNSDTSLTLSGTLFNGISQGASYGDDAQMDSNYPLVRFTDAGGDVIYGRTYNWSSTSVQTGGRTITTQCTVPATVLDNPGAYYIQVVANGNASAPFAYAGPVWVDFNYTSELGFYFGTYDYPYNTLAQGISAVNATGTLSINSSTQASDSPGPVTISKPMTIISVNGPSTIGQ